MTAQDQRQAKIAFYDAYALSAGAGIALRDIIRRLDRERFEPVAVLGREGPLAEMLREVTCPVEVLEPPPPLNVVGGGLSQAGLRGKLQAGWALARYSREVAAWLRRHEVDLLHCNQTRAALQAGPGARLAHVPMVWNVRIRERLPRVVVRIAEACADLIIPLTDRDFEGLPDERRLLRKSTVIRNAVDIRQFSPDRDRSAARARFGVPDGVPLVVSVGVLVHRKGFDLLIRAMEWIRRAHLDVRLLIAGEEPDGVPGCREELEEIIADLDLQDAVTLLGHRDDIPELLTACDVFALASREEGDPAVVLEAMASGRPVFVTEPASAAVEHFETGFITRSHDYLWLSDHLAHFLACPGLHRKWGERGRQVVEKQHDIVAMVRRYEDAWAGVLDARR